MGLDNNIEKLLEKYFEATTTVAEENSLREYFAQESVATHLEQYKPMFSYFSNAKNEQYTKLNSLSESVKPKRKTSYRWISAAASVVIAVGTYFGYEEYTYQQEQKEARLVYAKTKEAFGLLAENFNKGTEKVALLEEFEVAKQKVLNNN